MKLTSEETCLPNWRGTVKGVLTLLVITADACVAFIVRIMLVIPSRDWHDHENGSEG